MYRLSPSRLDDVAVLRPPTPLSPLALPCLREHAGVGPVDFEEVRRVKVGVHRLQPQERNHPATPSFHL